MRKEGNTLYGLLYVTEIERRTVSDDESWSLKHLPDEFFFRKTSLHWAYKTGIGMRFPF